MFVGTGKPRKPSAKAAARILRENGWSYKKIAAELGISPSSAFNWTNDILLTEEQINFNNGRGLTADTEVVNLRARSWSKKNRDRRAQFQLDGRVRAHDGDPLHEAGCMLYWAEGAKDKNCVAFCNSDLNMVRFFARFLRECFDLGPESFSLSLNVYLGNGLTIEEIEDYWLTPLGLPRTSLRKHQIESQEHVARSAHLRRHSGVRRLRRAKVAWLVAASEQELEQGLLRVQAVLRLVPDR